VLQRGVEGPDIHAMPFGHQPQERGKVEVCNRRQYLINLPYHSALPAVQQFELGHEARDSADLFNEIAGLIGRTAAQPAHVRSDSGPRNILRRAQLS
jgi:hypothetical protein